MAGGGSGGASGLVLRGAVAVVTGTSSGLGRRLALDLATAGAVVTALARRADLQEALAAELAAASPGSTARSLDVSDVDGFTRALAEVEEEHGRVDLLVNNAAHFEPKGAMTLEGVRAVFEVNVFAAVAGTLAVLPGMEARGRGAVVNISSDIARAPIPAETAYGASKAALTAFTESLAFRTASRGVSLHVVYPGFIPRGGYEPPRGLEGLGQRLTLRTDEAVSGLVLSAVRRGRPHEVNAATVPRLAPAFKALAPMLYRRMASGAAPADDH